MSVELVRVLVVDDYQAIANGLCRQLRLLGHEPRPAYRAAAAVAEAAVFLPELVLTDVSLPDATGYEVAARIRTWASWRLYVVTMSTHPAVSHPAVDEHLLKPFGLQQLSAVLARSHIVLRDEC